MADLTGTKAVLIDGEFTITREDVTPGAPQNLTSFTTQALDHRNDSDLTGYYLDCYKDRGLCTECKVIFHFNKDTNELRILYYSETLNAGARKQELHPHEFTAIDSKLTVEKTEISPNKYKLEITAFKFTAKPYWGDETRVVSGKGHFLFSEITMPV